MAQVSKYPIPKEVADRIFEIFLDAFVKLRDRREAEQFLTSLLTPTEKIVLAKRLAIAFLLEKGYDYETIKKVLRVSSPTIASVKLVKNYMGEGYERIIGRILRDQKIKNFIEKSIINLISPMAVGSKGGTWRYLKMELEKEQQKREVV